MLSAAWPGNQEALNPGGQSRLGRLLGWHYSTVWRKLNGKSQITRGEGNAIRHAVVLVQEESVVQQ
jgi:hypothetical protein